MLMFITSLNLRIKRGGARTWFDGEMTVNLAFFISLCTQGFFFYRCLIISCSFNCAIFSPACDSSPCLNGGTCFENEGGEYICKCSSGWGGNNCEKKTGSRYY